MKIAIMQPYLFPYLGYFHLINAVDTFIIFDDVHYINKGYINRNSILVGGQAHKFTLELIGASQNKLINQIEIGHNAEKLLRTIELAYKKAPFFQDFFPVLMEIMHSPEKNLARFIRNSLEKLTQYIGLKTHFCYSSEIEKDNALKAQAKILDICNRLNVAHYVNAIGGQDLYDKEIFFASQIKLEFLKLTLTEYQQFENDFVPSLSIIDVLMFNARQDVLQMLNQYELI